MDPLTGTTQPDRQPGAPLRGPYLTRADGHGSAIESNGEVVRKGKEWSGVPVVITKSTVELVEMPAPNEDPKQQPAFLVNQGVADLIDQEFELFRPGLELMILGWQKEKERYIRKRRRS